MPSPTPTEAQIEKTREVAGENDYEFIEDLVDELNDSQWTRALALQTSWDEYPAGDTIALEGGRDAVNYSSILSREDIRGRMRLLLGLPEFRDASLTGQGYSHAVETLWRW